MPTTFSERLRLLRSKRYEELAHIVLGGPVGTFLTALISEIRWVTPNRLTLLCFVARLVACGLLLLQSPGADLAVALLLPTAIAIDIMDGSLARYRKIQSNHGAFLDKVSDAIAIVIFGAALAYRAWLETLDIRLVFLCFSFAMALLFRRYVYWLRNYLELQSQGALERTPNPGLSDLGLSQRMIYYASQSWRIVLISESDIYVAVSVALLLDFLPITIWIAGLGVLPWLIVVGAYRMMEVIRLERTKLD